MKKIFILVQLFFVGIFICGGQGLPTSSNAWPQLRVLDTRSTNALQSRGGDPAAAAAIIERALSSVEYAVTPGDSYELGMEMPTTAVSLMQSGSVATATSSIVVVKENYDLDIPYLSTINTKGMDFTDLRALVMEKLPKVLPRATRVSFTLGTPAQFDVQVFGEAGCPGIVTASALSRVSDVLEMAQGIWLGASIRRIELIRGGQSRKVDLFLYGFKGDVTQDPCVRPGDVIRVPRAEITVVVGGAVMYPGTYEMVHGETFDTLIDYAGGVTFGSKSHSAEICRVNADGGSTEIDVDDAPGKDLALFNGDRIRVD